MSSVAATSLKPMVFFATLIVLSGSSHSRAADARRGDAASATGGGRPQASDPQLEGMDPDGAKDPAYQATYRTCMRKAGF